MIVFSFTNERVTRGVTGDNKKSTIYPELWQACAGSLVNLPAAGTLVYYFPQGHSEQVAASMKKDVDAQIPNYPNLPSKLLCLLHNVTLHADPETDEVYAQMTLQPVPSYDSETLLRSDISLKSNKPQPEFFCKTLTASDTSTHGGFSVPRRAAEKIFPLLDFSLQPPAQELVARDLHDTPWTFRHIYRGKPLRHLLTTGWSLFVSGKKLSAGDSVLFIRDEKQQLLLGIRRANRQSANLSSSVLSSDSMHIGILAAAAHAAANSSPFTVFYNPRTSPSEFVVPLAKYYKAVHNSQISLGMRFRMMFETEDSGTRRYMGTITAISDIDPVRWKNSQWRNLQVGWDESTAGERRNRVSVWDIEPVTAPFFIFPSPFVNCKRPRQPGIPGDDSSDLDNLFKRTMPWLDDMCMKDPQSLSGLDLVQLMNMQQNSSLATSIQPNYIQLGSFLQNLSGANLPRQLGLSTPETAQPNSLQYCTPRMPQQSQQLDQLPLQSSKNQMSSIIQPQQQLGDLTQHLRQNLANQAVSGAPAQLMQPQTQVSASSILQQQPIPDHQLSTSLSQSFQQQQNQQHILSQNQRQSLLQSQLPDHLNQQTLSSDNQIRLQLLRKLQQQQQSLLEQQTALQQSTQLAQQQDQQREILDASESLSRAMTPNRMLEVPKTIPNSISQPNFIPAGCSVSHPYQQQKFQHQQPGILSEIPGCMGLPNMLTNHLPMASSNTLTNTVGAGQCVSTGEVASCSTSLSTNNCQVAQPMINSHANHSLPICEDMALSTAAILSPSSLKTIHTNPDIVKDLQQKSDVKPLSNFTHSKNQVQGFFSSQAHANGVGAQTDYLDTSSSTTSVGISQNQVNLQQNNNSFSYNTHSMLLMNTSQDELLLESRRSISGGTNIQEQIAKATGSHHLLAKGVTGTGRDFPNNVSSGAMHAAHENSKDPHQELSSSMVSQSFGVPDMTFNSMDSAINDNFLSGGPWAAPPQLQCKRTYTKVYKRGAVGRSIDITRYSGYEELKQDLARRFGIEGQLEYGQRIGWKLVYVDNENDVLLLGDDPWNEFVNCVRCIKILSPQEVQQMSLDGDIGTSVLPNQACGSSENA